MILVLKQVFLFLTLAFAIQALLPESEATQREEESFRILAYVLNSQEQRPGIEAALADAELDLLDRDILLVNLGEIELESDRSVALGSDEKQIWRDMLQMPRSESRFVLVGKDGGAKAFQRDTLDLQLFFDLIDRMPMRIAELRERAGSVLN